MAIESITAAHDYHLTPEELQLVVLAFKVYIEVIDVIIRFNQILSQSLNKNYKLLLFKQPKILNLL